MNLKDKQLYRCIFQIIFQNPLVAKDIFSFVLKNANVEDNNIMVEILPLLIYISTRDYLDFKIIYEIGKGSIKNKDLLEIFNTTYNTVKFGR